MGAVRNDAIKITVATSLMLSIAYTPVSSQLNMHLFEHYPHCQARVNNSAFMLNSPSYCMEQIEFCANQTKCSIYTEEGDRYIDYYAYLPSKVTPNNYTYRITPEVEKELNLPKFKDTHPV